MSPFKLLKRALPVATLLITAGLFAAPASAGDGSSHGLTFNGKGQNGEPIYMNNGKGSAGDTHGLHFVNTGKIDPPNPDLAGKGRNGVSDGMALDASHPAKSTSVHPDLMKSGK